MNNEKAPSEERQMTEGEYRVGISFNPGGHEHVNKIKRMAAELIDYILTHGLDARTANMAATDFEVGAMNAVKSVTKPTRPVHLGEFGR